MSDPQPSRVRRLLAVGIKSSLALLLTLVAIELALRFLLFVDWGPTASLAKRLRDPASFSLRFADENWKLRFLFNDAHAPPPRYDPLLGWVNAKTEAETYAHGARASLAGRTPVLLYGDSFAACALPQQDCWEDLLERSPLAATHAVVNYGTGGYGFDQACLLLERSLPRWLDADPVVILSVLVDDDLDRTALTFRGWPKAHFDLGPDGELVLGSPPMVDAAAFVEAHPVGIKSYLWRYLVHKTQLVPARWREPLTGRQEIFSATKARTRKLLEHTRDLLEAADVPYFVLLFHGKAFLRPGAPENWRQGFLERELARLSMPWISSLDILRADGEAQGHGIADWFILKGKGAGHYGDLGNEVVFAAFERGLRGDFDGGDAPRKKKRKSPQKSGG